MTALASFPSGVSVQLTASARTLEPHRVDARCSWGMAASAVIGWVPRAAVARTVGTADYPAAQAEQIGSGGARVEKSGIEEIDLVSEELVAPGECAAGRLAERQALPPTLSHQLHAADRPGSMRSGGNRTHLHRGRGARRSPHLPRAGGAPPMCGLRSCLTFLSARPARQRPFITPRGFQPGSRGVGGTNSRLTRPLPRRGAPSVRSWPTLERDRSWRPHRKGCATVAGPRGAWAHAGISKRGVVIEVMTKARASTSPAPIFSPKRCFWARRLHGHRSGPGPRPAQAMRRTPELKTSRRRSSRAGRR